MADEVRCLKARLEEREKEIAALKNKLARVEKGCAPVPELYEKVTPLTPLRAKTALSNEDIMRYSRQLLLPELGVQGQLNLSKTSVLVVGCGGLGCPLAQYLAAAGIGRLGLLDYDEVELSNLHRQVLHGEETQGQAKALSAASAVKSRLNSTVECLPYRLQLSPGNALQLIQQYPPPLSIRPANASPLVSASALRMEGQLTVYNYRGGPLLQMSVPGDPPPPETVTNCSDGGVLGSGFRGIMGCFQALEVLKIASWNKASSLVMFDAQDTRFRSIKLRPKQAGLCSVRRGAQCKPSLVDYEAFCGSASTDIGCGRKLHLLSGGQRRITVQDYKLIMDKAEPHLLLDVRPLVEVGYMPLTFLPQLEERKSEHIRLLQERISLDSVSVKDICGGLTAWAKTIDPTFPQY
uniref:Molybdenum cofactor synthesis 3 n=1 Tax=Cyclopterus lumpus TaxID=8103 RepID=A0A8C2XRP6_CYCLU